MILADDKKAALLAIINMPGYQVLLDIGHDECEKLVTELLSVESDHPAIIAKHTGARFARLHFDRTCLRIESEAKSVLRPEKVAPLPLDFIPEARTQDTDLPADYIPEEFSGKRGPVITG